MARPDRRTSMDVGVDRDQHVSPGLRRVMDRLRDTPAQVVGQVGDTLWLTPVAVALLGDDSGYTGRARSVFYRWFTDPRARDRHFPEDHGLVGRTYVACLRASVSVHGPRSAAAAMVRTLRRESAEFAALWNRVDDDVPWSGARQFLHPEVGRVELFCQTLTDRDRAQFLLVFTATPGSESHEKLAHIARGS